MLAIRGAVLALSLVASLGVAAGCSDDEDEKGSGTTATATTPPVGVGAALPWERAFAGAEDRRVRVHLTTVPCRLPVVAVTLQQTDASVTIDVTGQDVPEDEPCIQVAARRCLLVTLAEPLGERELVDGATGERRPVEETGGDELRCTKA